MLKTIFSLLLLISCGSQSLHAIWSTTPDNVSAIGTTTKFAQVSTASSNGNAVAIWQDSAVRVSVKPFGQNWGTPVPLYTIAPSLLPPQPAVAMNSSGAAIAVWTETTSFTIQASVYDPNSGMWSTPTTISNPPGGYGSLFPNIAIDSLGNAIVLWIDTTFSVSNVNVINYVNGSWGSITNLATGIPSIQPLFPEDMTLQIAVDSLGNGVALFELFDGTYSRIAYATYTVGGSPSPWFIPSPPAAYISSSGANAFLPCISINETGNAVLVWQEDNGNAYASTLNFVSGAWTTPSSPSVISQAGEVVNDPIVAVDGSGNAVAVWFNSNDGTIRATSYTHSSNTWTTDQIISDTITNNLNPDVCVDTQGNAVAVWLNNTSNSVIGATLPFGGSWSAFQTISPVGQVFSADFPKVSCDSTGYAVAVWDNSTIKAVQSVHWTPAPTVLNVNPNSGPSGRWQYRDDHRN